MNVQEEIQISEYLYYEGVLDDVTTLKQLQLARFERSKLRFLSHDSRYPDGKLQLTLRSEEPKKQSLIDRLTTDLCAAVVVPSFKRIG